MVREIKWVLVVYKKSAYQLHVLERRDPHLLRLLRKGDPDAVDMQRAHAVHQQAMDAVTDSLKRLQVGFSLVDRANFRTAARYDLVVTVGGDGTMLQAAHVVDDVPMLGVNSDPLRSEAVFCAATRDGFEHVLRQALAGRLDELTLYRLQVGLNGQRLRPLVLNDVLIAHEDPATMSRYRLKVGSSQEDQKSSGLWVATAAGSSSAVLAAGGRRLPWTARRFQYRPRELYQGRLSRYRLTGGVLPMATTVEVTWLMRRGSAFIDGPHVRFPLRFGDRLVVRLSPTAPLRLLGVRSPHRVA